MRPVTIILLVVALGVAIVAAIVAKNFLDSRSTQTAEQAAGAVVGTREVLIAGRDIKVGSQVTSGDLEWKAWPEDLIDERYIVRAGEGDRVDTYAGSVARTAFAAGEPIQAVRLFKQGDAGFMAGMLGPGMRAVAIPVKPENSVGGFVVPGDRVDVLLSYRLNLPHGRSGGAGITPTKSNVHTMASETILRDARVLAIGTDMQGENGATAFKTVTLEVTPKGAEIISLGQQLGLLSLSLRSLATADEEGDLAYPETTTDLDTAQALRAAVIGDTAPVFKKAPSQPQVVITRPAPAPRRTTPPTTRRTAPSAPGAVTIYRGGVATQEKVSK